MATSPDALLALKGAIHSKSTIKYLRNGAPSTSISSATHIELSSTVTLPKNTPTRWQKPGLPKATAISARDPQANPSEFYTLEAVYLAWLFREASGADYVRQAREHGLVVGSVSITERKAVVDWLEGRTSSHERIVSLTNDSTTPPGTPPQLKAHLPNQGPSVTTTASPSKRKYIADTSDAEVVKKIKQNEIELTDRTSVLRGTKPNNFTSIRTVYAEKLKKLREASKPGAAQAIAAVAKPDPKAQARKARHMYPIIIISSSPTSLITMYNVKRFLQDSSFETPAEARERAAAEGNARAEDVVAIYRKRTHIDPSGAERVTQARYFVVDGVEALAKFGNDAWDRVIAVLTTGQAWQFKPYKWSDPRTLFHHVKGFHVSWANDPPNPKIKDWNVTDLKIDQHKRHVDKSVVASFWKTLDTWTLSNKPWLMSS